MTRGRSQALTRLLAVAGALIGAVATAVLPAVPAMAVPAPSLTVTGLEVLTGRVRFILTARDLPAGAALEPTDVSIRVGETVLDSHVVKITQTTRTLPPRALVVVLDTSASVTGGAIAAQRAAVRGLATTLPPDVLLGVVTTSTSPVLALRPTADRTAFAEAIDAIQPSGEGALRDAAMLARRSLTDLGFRPGSDQRLVALSPGIEDSSSVTLSQLEADLGTAGLPMDVVAIRAAVDGLAGMRELATAGNGRLFITSDAASVTNAVQTSGQSFSAILEVEAVVPDELARAAASLEVRAQRIGLSTAFPVAFTGPGRAPEPATDLFRWIPNWVAYILAALVFLALVTFVMGLLWPKSKKDERIRQIQHFGPLRTPVGAKPPTESAASALTRTALAATASVVRSRGGLEERMALRLDRAGMKLKPHEWLLLRGCVTITAGAAAFVLLGVVAALVGLTIGWLATVAYQAYRVDKRKHAFSDQLPDALQLVIGSLRAGFSLPQALDSLVREAADPVASEFGRAVAEHRLGADVSDALERVAVRTESEDLAWAVIAVRIQREVGGNLAEVLQTTVDTMRERARLRRHVRSLSAEGRISAWVLIGLPLGLATFMFAYRRSYLTPLFTDPRGLVMLLGGAALFVLGILWMLRVIRVED